MFLNFVYFQDENIPAHPSYHKKQPLSIFAQKNNLRRIANFSFVFLWSIHKLDLSSNNIIVIEKLAFAGLHGIEILNLQNNPISVIDLSGFRDASLIDLSNTEIRKLDDLQGLITSTFDMYEYILQGFRGMYLQHWLQYFITTAMAWHHD